MNLRKIFTALFICASLLPVSAGTINDQELIYSDHWAYEAFYRVAADAGVSVTADISPVSAGELKFHLRSINPGELSEAGLRTYERLHTFLYGDGDGASGFSFSWNLKITAEAYHKTNSAIDWSFYKYLEDYPVKMPLTFGFGNYLAFGTEMFFGKNIIQSALPSSITNIPLCQQDIDFLYPNKGWASAGIILDDWGLNLQIGRSDVTIGRSFKGSVFYNSTFETNAYIMGSLWSDSFKLNTLFSEIDYQRYMWLHEFQFTLLPNLTLGVSEGQMAVGNPELRFFNPMIVFHNFFPGDDYVHFENLEEKYDRKDCSYLGIFLEYLPVRNVRLYLNYAQDELQTASEAASGDYASLLPNAFGIQAGAEVWFNGTGNGTWKINAEGLYTTPFLYIKQKPECSLIRQRYDKPWSWMPGTSGATTDSWIGTPCGPDSIAGAVRLGYTCGDGGWNCFLECSFHMQGENDFSIFYAPLVEGTGEDGSQKFYYNFYPSVRQYYTKTGTLEENVALARNMMPSGTAETLYTVSAGGSYAFGGVKVSGKASYMVDVNSSHTKGSIQHGTELLVALSWSLY